MRFPFLDANKLDSLIELRSKIEDNQASVEDYHAYEEILDDYYDKSEIREPLYKVGIADYESLLLARNEGVESDRYEKIEGFLVGALLGLGLGIIMASAFRIPG